MSGTRGGSQRRVWRTRLVVAGLVPLLLALALVVKVGLMVGYDRGGRAAYEDGSFREARSSFAANTALNWFEPWIASYDEGLARYRLEDYEDAVRLYRTALDSVPAAERCRVRVNLALALESRGDLASAEGRPDDARGQWRQALGVVEECLDDGAVRAAGDVEAGRVVDARVREKLAEESTDPPLEPEPPREKPTPPPPTPEQLEQLQKQNQKAQERRREDEERREDRERPEPPAGEPPAYEW